MNTGPLRDITDSDAYTPPPEPVVATLNMNRVPVPTKTQDSLEYMAPENVGRVNVDTEALDEAAGSFAGDCTSSCLHSFLDWEGGGG